MSEILPIAAAEIKAPIETRSLWEEARRRLARNTAAVISVYVLIVIVLLASFGPFLWIYDADTIFKERVGWAPTWSHWHILGTDTEGRDMMARMLFGLGISLLVGVVATIVTLTIGVLWGATAGFLGGAVDQVMMRFVDVLYAIPLVFLVILLVAVVETNDPLSNLLLIFLAIGALGWLNMARIVRGQTISVRSKEFVEAARAAGATPAQIVVRHIIPNVLGPVIVYATLNLPIVILLESFLSFLGLGVQEPLTSLGQLISRGAREMQAAWWMLVSPAVAMLVTLLALNFVGDGLRDALDPKDR